MLKKSLILKKIYINMYFIISLFPQFCNAKLTFINQFYKTEHIK